MNQSAPKSTKAKLLTESALLKQAAKHYMSGEQLAFFRHRLTLERNEVAARIYEATLLLRADGESERISDTIDYASREEGRQWQMRQLDRDRQLIRKIDQALARIEDGSYGWCEETGEPIGLRRLLSRPVTTLSIEAKTRQEQLERHGIRTRFPAAVAFA